MSREFLFETPKEILLDCSHDQGGTFTCGFHAVTALLTAFYNQNKAPDKPKINLSVMGLIKQLDANLSSETNIVPALWHVKTQVKERKLLISKTELCVKDVHSGQMSFDLPECPLDADTVVIPDFNLQVFNNFSNKTEMIEKIIGHFKESRPLPLALNICMREPCAHNLHAVLAIGIDEINCVARDGNITKVNSIFLQNSWGGKGNGPYNLEHMAEGMKKSDEKIITISLCTEKSPCIDKIQSEDESSFSTLIHYILSNDLRSIQRILKEHHSADINKVTTIDGSTLLFIATYKGYDEIVKTLLEHHADVDKGSAIDGSTPLFVASQKKHEKIVHMLLEKGADVNKARTIDGATPLLVAIQLQQENIIKMLLEKGADVNQASTTDGSTPLFIASFEGYENIVRMLLEKGADVNKEKASTGSTPLIAAVLGGHIQIVNMLLEKGADVNKARTSYPATPLAIARKDKKTEILKILIKARIEKRKQESQQEREPSTKRRRGE